MTPLEKLLNFAEQQPAGIWALAILIGAILFVPLALMANYLAGRP